jgi:dolichyl-phosphate-mannose--protein O-mannosyl transferase
MVVGKMITKITASFDRSTNKHQIDVEFSKVVALLLATTPENQHRCAVKQNFSENKSEVLCVSGEYGSGGDAGKKSWGSTINSAAKHTYSVTVE